jgi:uncharacterized membrane protein
MITRNKTQIAWRYSFAIVVIIAGLLTLHYNIENEFLGFSSVGTWLIYVGFVMLAIITLQLISNKKRVVDERMQFIASKAGRITFLAIILSSFIIMIADGIKPITIPYSYFMSYFVCGIILVYVISYKMLLKYS